MSRVLQTSRSVSAVVAATAVAVWMGAAGGCSEPEPFPYEEVVAAASVKTVRTLPPPDVPRCGASVSEGKVRVRAKQTPIAASSAKRVTVYPFDQDAILVGVKAGRASPDNPGDGKLWKVPCSQADTATVAFEQKHADFGYGVVAPDRKRILFTGHDGIYALAIRDAAGEPGPHPPAVKVVDVPEPGDGCWLHGEPAARSRSRNIVKGLTADRKSVVFERWTPCGYDGVWTGTELHLANVGTKDDLPVSPRPVATVAVDSRERVWLGDAGRCHEPGVIDVQTPGHIYLSRDKAESWKRIQVFADNGPMPTAAKFILTDAKQQGAAIVLASICNYKVGKRGGYLYFTRSVGANWARIPIPEDVGVKVDGGYGATAVEIVEGDIDKLIVWGRDGRAFRTRIGSGNWRPADGVGMPPMTGNQNAQVGSFKLRATREGLQRIAVDGSSTYVFPSPETRLSDLPESQSVLPAGASDTRGAGEEYAPSK